MEHKPVLLSEVVEYLKPQAGKEFIDATINGGGHAKALLDKILPDGKILGIDWDSQLIEKLSLEKKNSKYDQNLILVNDSYVNLAEIAKREKFLKADGVLFDLGMSSWQLEEAGRGFSFQRDEVLDMRFSGGEYDSVNTNSKTAAEIVNQANPVELERILKDYGEERFAGKIARAIARARKKERILTTFQLVEIIKQAVPFWYRRGRIHFATKTFQALRIAANNELENIREGLKQAIIVLKNGGRIAVITFHSLEDRIVKTFFRESEELRAITKKPIQPSLAEVTLNPRARSAKLRIAEKIRREGLLVKRNALAVEVDSIFETSE